MARVVIQPLNHLRQIMTECVSHESVFLSWFNTRIHYFFRQHADLIKKVAKYGHKLNLGR